MDLTTVVAEKAAEEAVGAVAQVVTDTGFVNKLLGKVSLALGDCFQRYLRNAEASYNQVRTLATEPDLRTMLGENGIYVQVGVGLTRGRTENEIPASKIESLLAVSNRILIEGSGGMGKSMLMKYLFLDTIRRGAYMKKPYIPVFLELRRVSEQKPGQVSIPELVYACMRNHDVELKREHFPESLRMGKYLFLLDGFDEVKDSLSAEVAEKLNDFSTQYPQNAFIVTSRPANDYENAPFRNFVKMRSMPLNKGQAVELAQRISKTWTWQGDREKAADFCKQLEETLYEKHKTFAQNPLLLSMMFLTFMRNSSIPDHEAEFYRESYDALYSKHDTHDKGSFLREFKCGNLGKDEFTKLFARFCFQSYMREKYEFSEREILDFLRDSIAYLKLSVNAEDYLSDLRKIVCMIVREGNVYQFAHRSFQEYFAAVYTAGLSDADQKRVLDAIALSVWDTRFLYYRLLFQIEGERFKVNALEEKLRGWLNDMENNANPDVFLLKRMFRKFVKVKDVWVARANPFIFQSEICYICQSIDMVSYIIPNSEFLEGFGKTLIDFHYIDDSGPFARYSHQEREALYTYLVKELHIPEFRAKMQQWLDGLDAKRKAAKRDDFFTNL
ncbi:MAG: NACHT domain-containing protein [Oscillibacter sp.]|nr:NACHT domain-containing protein [Oscillibacter sp.]